MACVLKAVLSEALEMIGRKMSAEDVMAEVMKDLPFYEESGGGVTFSGGEPLLQPDFLESLLILAKRNKLHTVVDTSGQANFSVFQGSFLTSTFFSTT